MSEQRSNHNSLYDNSDYPSRHRTSRPEDGYRTRREGEPRSRQEDPPRRPRRRRRGVGHVIGAIFKVLGTLLLIGLCTGAILCCFGAMYIRTIILPGVDVSLDDFQLGENSVMYYKDPDSGAYKELTTLLNTTSSIWVDFEEIPKNLINATVAIEDRRFWTHPGVDWRRTGKAVLDMFTGNSISGGSTITQQLIKNMTQYNETTVKRKITEIFRALRFTQNNSKNDTITYYLNIIPLGSGCDGVGAASYEYFGKPVSQLTLAECASLIGITNNPSLYGPYSTAVVWNEREQEMWTARQWNKYRQEVVLGQMLDQKMISRSEYDEAVAQELVFVRETGEADEKNIYSWYEETVRSDVRKDLKERLEWSDQLIDQMLARGGLRIYTCIDPRIQAIAEDVYTNRENLDFTSKNGQRLQSSITVIDNATGNIVAIVGQFDEKTGNLWNNYANAAQRQPGSSLKPLSVYSPALEMGQISPITIIDDYPYNDSNRTGWPINSGAARYAGLTTVRSGLTHSVNTIAVRVLADRVTVNQSFNFVQDRYHIDLEEALRTSNGQIKSDLDIAPLSMGGLTKGVCTRDMAAAYAVFPNMGVYTPSRTYTKITRMIDGQEVTLLENEPERENAIKDTTAYYINSMLSNVVASGTGTKAKLSNMTAAGKTGTTSENNDRWFVGYTPYYTAAVWTGYPTPAKMNLRDVNPAVTLWRKVMAPVHEGLENKSFPVPNGLKPVNYCLDSGLLATDYCRQDPRGSRVASDNVFQEDFPDQYCTAHTEKSVVTVCKDCPILTDDGKETGLYHTAGPYCPETSLQQMCLPDYERAKIGTAVARDEMYRKSTVESYGVCTVHTQAPPPDIPDPPIGTDPGSGSSGNPNGSGGSGNPNNPSNPNGSGNSGNSGEVIDPEMPQEPAVPAGPNNGHYVTPADPDNTVTNPKPPSQDIRRN